MQFYLTSRDLGYLHLEADARLSLLRSLVEHHDHRTGEVRLSRQTLDGLLRMSSKWTDKTISGLFESCCDGFVSRPGPRPKGRASSELLVLDWLRIFPTVLAVRHAHKQIRGGLSRALQDSSVYKSELSFHALYSVIQTCMDALEREGHERAATHLRKLLRAQSGIEILVSRGAWLGPEILDLNSSLIGSDPELSSGNMELSSTSDNKESINSLSTKGRATETSAQSPFPPRVQALLNFMEPRARSRIEQKLAGASLKAIDDHRLVMVFPTQSRAHDLLKAVGNQIQIAGMQLGWSAVEVRGADQLTLPPTANDNDPLTDTRVTGLAQRRDRAFQLQSCVQIKGGFGEAQAR